MSKNSIEIIYQDDNLLAVNKPVNVSVTTDRSGKDGIIDLLSKQLPADTDLRLIHRLGKQTSGIMLIAKNKETQSSFASLLEKGNITRTYIAIVTGCPPNSSGIIKTPINRSRKDQRLMCIDPKRGKPAQTLYRVIADYGIYSLLTVQPLTVRTHQIRLHLSHKNIPLAIDPLYGSSEPIMLSHVKSGYRFSKNKTESPLIDRLTLHAYQITVPDICNCPTTFIAPLEKKFAAAVKMLTKHNPKGTSAITEPDIFDNIIKPESPGQIPVKV